MLDQKLSRLEIKLDGEWYYVRPVDAFREGSVPAAGADGDLSVLEWRMTVSYDGEVWQTQE